MPLKLPACLPSRRVRTRGFGNARRFVGMEFAAYRPSWWPGVRHRTGRTYCYLGEMAEQQTSKLNAPSEDRDLGLRLDRTLPKSRPPLMSAIALH